MCKCFYCPPKLAWFHVIRVYPESTIAFPNNFDTVYYALYLNNDELKKTV